MGFPRSTVTGENNIARLGMTDGKALLTDELLLLVEETARAQNRKPEEVVSEAVQTYLDEQSFVQFVRKNEKRARANGTGEQDVERLIAEYRQENRER